jgi:hypothetical protein
MPKLSTLRCTTPITEISSFSHLYLSLLSLPLSSLFVIEPWALQFVFRDCLFRSTGGTRTSSASLVVRKFVFSVGRCNIIVTLTNKYNVLIGLSKKPKGAYESIGVPSLGIPHVAPE